MNRFLVLLLAAIAAAESNQAATPAVTLPSNFNLAFDDEFTSLDTIAPGPSGSSTVSSGVNWATQAGNGAKFGNATWTGQSEGSGIANPYSLVTQGGIPCLKITLSKDSNGTLRSGLISTQDRSGKGFALALGYWEAKIWCPSGPGTWPAFWFVGTNAHSSNPFFEWDDLEEWGDKVGPDGPTQAQSTVIGWQGATGGTQSQSATISTLTSAWHVFSMWIQATKVIFYIDGKQVATAAAGTPAADWQQPAFCMIDYACGPGTTTFTGSNYNPINDPDYGNIIVPNGMYVAYVRAWGANATSVSPTPASTPGSPTNLHVVLP
jgi:beta-glucanase (GH16 family)